MVIFLAAGMSRRMGKENKLLLPFAQSTVIETTLKNILAANIGKIVAVVGHEAEQVRPILQKYPLSIVENLSYETGMTSSIQAGVKVVEDAEFLMVCLSDMVLIQPEEYEYLISSFLYIFKTDEKAIVVPVFGEKRGNPVVFSSFYKKDILNLTYEDGCKPIVQAHKNHVYLIEMPSDSILIDLDDPEQYQKLIAEL